MRSRPWWAALLGLFLQAQAGCFLPPAQPGQRLSEVALNMSMLTRFGRTEAALDYVDPSAKEAFAERRAPWEKELRVLDVELTDLRLNTKDDADVVLNVMWQRLDESDVRETQLEQHWRDGRKGWKLVSESAKGGDKALLPPPPKTDEAKATAPPKQL